MLLQALKSMLATARTANTLKTFFIVYQLLVDTPKLGPITLLAVKKFQRSPANYSSHAMHSGPDTPDPPRIPDIGAGWNDVLKTEFVAPYFAALKHFLVQERAVHTVYPRGSDILRAFRATPFEAVRVVILGQDPYHGPGQAHGLSFSVPKGIPPPPSLQNMIKEIQRNPGDPASGSGDLTCWAEQGVLLLNATLTVRAGEAASHQGKGWERFTDAAIAGLSRQRSGLVFLLWGRHAQAKETLIDSSRHYILKAPHPSPLSAHRGFLGCGHFASANEILQAQGGNPIDWTT